MIRTFHSIGQGAFIQKSLMILGLYMIVEPILMEKKESKNI